MFPITSLVFTIPSELPLRFEVEVTWIPDVTPEDLFDHLWREKDRHPTR